MKAIYLCGGTRFECFSELVDSRILNVTAVICGISKYNKPDVNQKFQEKCVFNDIPFFLIEKNELRNLVENIDFDLLISVGYRFIIDKITLNKAMYAINVHPTLLPKYRGYRSGPFIIINNERETGVTVHFIDEGIDTGDIILQRKISLTPFDTVKSMARKTGLIEGSVLIEALKMILTRQFKRIKQDEAKATIYNQVRTPKDSELDSNKSLKELYNYIRACDPIDYPAFFYINGEKVFIKLWRSDKPATEFDMI
jgi:methionyl-tRNA formyltransferase